jgi:two-component system sensor histidine kinase AlgZ
LCRQYLNLEKLRLGERLNVEWELADLPLDLEVPPLLVQPLLENAVYHGIEPAETRGTIRIRVTRSGDELHIDLAIPVVALPNIRGAITWRSTTFANAWRCTTIWKHALTPVRSYWPTGSCEYRVRIVLPCRVRS